ncbi:shikimate dehydrogenase [Streptosporangium sp. NBC_01755]|uniref:shikimate dehydrogenase n=1 Tax=unclassified Streptosporangium TaxID=2632669 RepID=UPI002DDC40D8|nr:MULTISPECIES: shikimate dehydrogenase [unclassified Streptosporangium]WSA29278.1 shikimate dehydrogenase [Streptosporangium sp. NBC_01810]WSC99278.1 shikimate dehydrogenase [Streptosporangium sp. NBC_01755]
MLRAAVLGSPIVHSLSPYLHRAAYEGMGLHDWRYEAIECDEAGLPGLVDGLDADWVGLSLTMPLKRAVLPLLDTVSDLALQVGGANTVILRDGARHGDNTDVYGIVQALAEAGVTTPASATVLGGGATASSALAALRELGLGEATLVVRDPSRAAETVEAAERLDMSLAVQTFDKLDIALEVDLVVSTLPSGAADGFTESLADVPALFDVVYAPWPTRPAAAVAARGGIVVGGLPMLLHQAVRQVEMMTGRADVPVEAMREAGKAEIVRRAASTE